MTIKIYEYKKDNMTVREYMKQAGIDQMTDEEEADEAIDLLVKMGYSEEANEIKQFKKIDMDAATRQIVRNAGVELPGTTFEKVRDRKELDKLEFNVGRG